jgi:hypothetical protein
MRGQAWSGTLAATVLAAAVVVVAQSPSPSPNAPTPAPQPPATAQPPTTAPSQSSEGHRITVAGCLQTSPPAPTGTSGSTSSAPADGATAKPDAAGDAKFVLANAVPSAADASPTGSNSSTPRTYRLIANEAALNPHVGKKLEITGTVDEQDSAAPPAASDSSAPSAASAPKLRVEAGKVLAEPCTTK